MSKAHQAEQRAMQAVKDHFVGKVKNSTRVWELCLTVHEHREKFSDKKEAEVLDLADKIKNTHDRLLQLQAESESEERIIGLLKEAEDFLTEQGIKAILERFKNKKDVE